MSDFRPWGGGLTRRQALKLIKENSSGGGSQSWEQTLQVGRFASTTPELLEPARFVLGTRVAPDGTLGQGYLTFRSDVWTTSVPLQVRSIGNPVAVVPAAPWSGILTVKGNLRATGGSGSTMGYFLIEEAWDETGVVDVLRREGLAGLGAGSPFLVFLDFGTFGSFSAVYLRVIDSGNAGDNVTLTASVSADVLSAVSTPPP